MGSGGEGREGGERRGEGKGEVIPTNVRDALTPLTLINEEQVSMPRTAYSNRHNHRSRELRTVLTTQRHFRTTVSKQSCIENTDIMSSVF